MPTEPLRCGSHREPLVLAREPGASSRLLRGNDDEQDPLEERCRLALGPNGEIDPGTGVEHGELSRFGPLRQAPQPRVVADEKERLQTLRVVALRGMELRPDALVPVVGLRRLGNRIKDALFEREFPELGVSLKLVNRPNRLHMPIRKRGDGIGTTSSFDILLAKSFSLLIRGAQTLSFSQQFPGTNT